MQRLIVRTTRSLCCQLATHHRLTDQVQHCQEYVIITVNAVTPLPTKAAVKSKHIALTFSAHHSWPASLTCPRSQDTLMGNQTASSLSLFYTQEIPEYTIQNGRRRKVSRKKAETVKRILVLSDKTLQDLESPFPASSPPPWLLPWGSMGEAAAGVWRGRLPS